MPPARPGCTPSHNLVIELDETLLLSDDASWVTGAILNVDGGVMAGRQKIPAEHRRD